jgi:hypothetical protein
VITTLLAVVALEFLVLAVLFGALYFKTREVTDLLVAAAYALGVAMMLATWIRS